MDWCVSEIYGTSWGRVGINRMGPSAPFKNRHDILYPYKEPVHVCAAWIGGLNGRQLLLIPFSVGFCGRTRIATYVLRYTAYKSYTHATFRTNLWLNWLVFFLWIGNFLQNETQLRISCSYIIENQLQAIWKSYQIYQKFLLWWHQCYNFNVE